MSRIILTKEEMGNAFALFLIQVRGSFDAIGKEATISFTEIDGEVVVVIDYGDDDSLQNVYD